MGSPLSPVLADLYMEHFEMMPATQTAQKRPSLWYRYMGDTFIIWPHGRESLDDFLSHINSLRPSIKFTMETENDGRLPFLDVLVQREGSSLVTTVYRKTTHTDCYLNFRSNHHPRIKTGIVKCLAHRAKSVCHPSHMKSELEHLQEVFTLNDYPLHVVKRCLEKTSMNTTTTDSTEPADDKPKILCLPYVRDLSESIERSCRDLNLKIVFQSRRTLHTILSKVKDNPAEEKVKGVVYKIDCSCGDTYIGETGRTLKVRLKEHKRAVCTQLSTNGIAVHVNQTGHDIEWNSAQVLERESKWWKRRYKEALRIQAESTTMNLDQGLQLNSIWSTLNKQ